MNPTVSAQFFPATGSPFAHLGPAPAVAYNPEAPDDEVRDAGREVMQDYFAATPEQLGLTELVGQVVRLKDAEDTATRLMAKALKYAHPGSSEAKAETQPFNSRISGGGLYLPKPGLTFQTLRQLSQRVEVARAVHNTVVSQVLRFAEPSQKDEELGWRIHHQDRNAALTDEQEEFFSWLTSFMVSGGRDFGAMMRRKKSRDSIRVALAKLTEDTLTLDNVAVETVPLQGVDGLDAFFVRDGATFFPAAKASAGTRQDDDGIYAYQVVPTGGERERPFRYEELAIFQRNLSTDLEWTGYGRSELESSVSTLSLFLQAIAHTQEGIDSNAIPRGFLTIFGKYDRRTQEAFKAAWSAQLRGVRNAFNLPVLFSQGQQGAAQFTSTGTPFSEMAFARWIQLQTAIMCAIYGLDPIEIGMESWSAAGKSGLAGDDTEERLASSKSKMLGPLLVAIGGFFSDELLARFSRGGTARFSFTGLLDEERKARRELQVRMSTINEVRASLGMPKHPHGWFGDLPADSSLLAAEKDRLTASLTFNEARKVWGGLDAFPDERVGMSPLNPSLGATWNQVVQSLAPEPEPAPGGPGNPFDTPPEGEEPPPEWDGEDTPPSGEGGDQAPDAGGEQGQGQEDAPPPVGGARKAEMARAMEAMR